MLWYQSPVGDIGAAGGICYPQQGVIAVFMNEPVRLSKPYLGKESTRNSTGPSHYQMYTVLQFVRDVGFDEIDVSW